MLKVGSITSLSFCIGLVAHGLCTVASRQICVKQCARWYKRENNRSSYTSTIGDACFSCGQQKTRGVDETQQLRRRRVSDCFVSWNESRSSPHKQLTMDEQDASSRRAVQLRIQRRAQQEFLLFLCHNFSLVAPRMQPPTLSGRRGRAPGQPKAYEATPQRHFKDFFCNSRKKCQFPPFDDSFKLYVLSI